MAKVMDGARVYRLAFLVGCVVIGGGMGLGVFQSVVADHRLPPVNISNIGEIQALLDAGRYEDAIPRLGMTIELIPQNQHVMLNMRGNAYNALGRYDEAIDDFRRAIEIAPGFAEAYNNLGIAYIGNDALDEAVRQFDHAVRIDPSFDVARQNLARAVGDYEASGGPSAPATAEAIVESEELQQARIFVERFFLGELDWLHASFTDAFVERMSLDDLGRFRQQVTDQLGIENDLLGDRLEPTDVGHTYKRWSRFNHFPGVVELALDLRADWTVDDLRIRLSETTPEELGSN